MGSAVWSDLLAAIALMLVFEGMVLALFSSRLSDIVERLRAIGPEQARWIGLAMAGLGTVVYALLRG